MYEARQNKEKVSRRIDGGGMVRQRKKNKRSELESQIVKEIDIRHFISDSFRNNHIKNANQTAIDVTKARQRQTHKNTVFELNESEFSKDVRDLNVKYILATQKTYYSTSKYPYFEVVQNDSGDYYIESNGNDYIPYMVSIIESNELEPKYQDLTLHKAYHCPGLNGET